MSECQDIIIGCLLEFTIAVIEDNRNLGIVKKVVVCSKNTTKDAQAYLKDKQYIQIYGSEFIEDETISCKLYEEIGLRYRNLVFNNNVVDKFIKIVSPQWHSYRQGKPITLT